MVATPKRAKPATTDEEWINGLESNPGYQGIDIRRELGKCQAYFPRLIVSRKRFLNWLNRADRPIQANGTAQPVRGLAVFEARERARQERGE